MRTAYHEQLDALTNQLAEMCRMAASQMERATQALLQADLHRREQVIGDHENIIAASARAEEAAWSVALQGRWLETGSGSWSIQIVADVERMGAPWPCMSPRRPSAPSPARPTRRGQRLFR